MKKRVHYLDYSLLFILINSASAKTPQDVFVSLGYNGSHEAISSARLVVTFTEERKHRINSRISFLLLGSLPTWDTTLKGETDRTYRAEFGGGLSFDAILIGRKKTQISIGIKWMLARFKESYTPVYVYPAEPVYNGNPIIIDYIWSMIAEPTLSADVRLLRNLGISLSIGVQYCISNHSLSIERIQPGIVYGASAGWYFRYN